MCVQTPRSDVLADGETPDVIPEYVPPWLKLAVDPKETIALPVVQFLIVTFASQVPVRRPPPSDCASAAPGIKSAPNKLSSTFFIFVSFLISGFQASFQEL